MSQAIGTKIATRETYGKTLARLGLENKNIVVLDADFPWTHRLHGGSPQVLFRCAISLLQKCVRGTHGWVRGPSFPVD